MTADFGDSFGMLTRFDSGANEWHLTAYHKPSGQPWAAVTTFTVAYDAQYDGGYLGLGLSGDPGNSNASPYLDDFGGGFGVPVDTYVPPGSPLEVFNASTVDNTTRVIQLNATAAAGSPPIIVASNTRVDNLNADLLDGNHASNFVPTSRMLVS